MRQGSKKRQITSDEVKAKAGTFGSRGGASSCEINALDARVVEAEACATELERQIEQSVWQVRVAERKYSYLYDVSQTLNQRLAMGVFCEEGMEQRLINEKKDLWGFTEALHSNAAKSQNSVGETFCGRFA